MRGREGARARELGVKVNGAEARYVKTVTCRKYIGIHGAGAQGIGFNDVRA
jgi:hypothetical protein